MFQDPQTFTQDKKLPLGVAEEDVRESTTCLLGNEDEHEEEELLSEGSTLSEKNEKVNEEEELLRQAIALSLED